MLFPLVRTALTPGVGYRIVLPVAANGLTPCGGRGNVGRLRIEDIAKRDSACHVTVERE